MELWSEPVQHNRDSEWSKKVKEKLRDTTKKENVIITEKELKRAIARMSNFKSVRPDHVQGFWFKESQSTSQTQITSKRVMKDQLLVFH